MQDTDTVRAMLDEIGPFRSEPLIDFAVPGNTAAFEAALTRVRAKFGRRYPLLIGGEEIETAETFTTINPARPDQVIGIFSRADAALAVRAVEAATSAFATWGRSSATTRAKTLLRAAGFMRTRRQELNAWMVYEEGKAWGEADADTAEAIDYLEYYARQALKLELVQVNQARGERDALHYLPLGVGAIIPPWNFPIAIPTGMSSAAIAAGNTIVLKPASSAARVAWEFTRILRDAGLPPGVCNYLTGPGTIAGETLVDHPQTRFIAFTGSRDVGLRINERAARTQPGQLWIKRAILEMGGKGAVVVDETADLDAAATGIVTSAFGYQGQKCSAGSRAILVDEVYDALVERVVAQARERLVIGDPEQREHTLGPVASESQFRKVLDYIEIGKHEGQLIFGGSAVAREGYFIEPTIFAGVAPDARIAQEEIFGPVLAIIRAGDWQDAIKIANGTVYGLTGAYYSNDPQRLAYARREFHVGNLYLNRKCTGALVGIHPFGGFNMSGTDSKAGGRDYLLLFLQAKAVSQKV